MKKPLGMGKLRCFVAMAFGREDCDEWFAAVQRVLKEKFDLRRVDRLNHNMNIDQKILREIEDCDLVLADLTYARPSVYFEAGFAEARGTPVVYSVRSDHLSPHGAKRAIKSLAQYGLPEEFWEEEIATDALSSRRVHFDVANRNIIPWALPVSKTTQDRLQARFALVARPLLRDKEQREAFATAEHEFVQLSQQEKRQQLISEASKVVRRAGFEPATFYRASGPILYDYSFEGALATGTAALSLRRLGDTVQALFVVTTDEATRSCFESLLHTHLDYPTWDLGPTLSGRAVRKFEVRVLLLSTKRISPERVADKLPCFRYVSESCSFVGDVRREFPRLRSYPRPLLWSGRRDGFGHFFVTASSGGWRQTSPLNWHVDNGVIRSEAPAGRIIGSLESLPYRMVVQLVSGVRSIVQLRESVGSLLER